MRIIAHRGYSGAYPEHTIEAYEQALALPIHGVECDIRLTRDGQLVLFHDPVVDRVSDGRGRLSTFTLEQLHNLNIGTKAKPAQVITLDDLIDLILASGEHHLYIETKHPNRYGRMLEEQLVLRLHYRGLLVDPRIHVISFSPVSLARMRKLAPNLDRVLLRRSWQRMTRPAGSMVAQPTGVGLSIKLAKLRPNLLVNREMPTYMWTVNEPEDIGWAYTQGVDMLATNEPREALGVVGALYRGAHG